MPWMKAEHACCVLCGVELQEYHDLLVCQVHAAQVFIKTQTIIVIVTRKVISADEIWGDNSF